MLLAGEAAPLSTAAIAKSIGANRSLVSRVLSELQSRRLVERVPGKTYELGPRILELGAAYAATQGFGQSVHATLNEVAHATAQTTNLAILVDLDVLYLMKHEGRDSVIGVSQVGSRLPASCTAVGKALLSCLEDGDIERRYASVTDLPRLTPHSVGTLGDLLRDVRATRDRGYAIERDETAVGRTCLAMAVSWHGVPCNRAALGVSMANATYDDDAGTILPRLQMAAARLEKEAAARLVLEGPSDPSRTYGERSNGQGERSNGQGHREGPAGRGDRIGAPAPTRAAGRRAGDGRSSG
jgi:DNA-binding IclR family transcriptional regulator